ncbi:hypothetical protein [Propioniciclava flava]
MFDSLVAQGRTLASILQHQEDELNPEWIRELNQKTRESWEFVESALVLKKSGEFFSTAKQFTSNVAQVIFRAPANTTLDVTELEKQLNLFATGRRALTDRLGVRFSGPDDPAYEVLDERLKARTATGQEAGPRAPQSGGDPSPKSDATKYLERVVAINRVAKRVQGGSRFSFTVLVVVGDGEGTVGVGVGKAKAVNVAMEKGVQEAKKRLFRVPPNSGHDPAPCPRREGGRRRHTPACISWHWPNRQRLYPRRIGVRWRY